MTYFCPPFSLSITRYEMRERAEKKSKRELSSTTPDNPMTIHETFKEYLKHEVLLKRLERHPQPKRPGKRYSPVIEARGELIEQIDSFFPSHEAPHKQQVGLYILVDKLLTREELRRSISEGTLLTAAEAVKGPKIHPQRLLQKINRLLQESDNISLQITVRAPRSSSPYCFISSLVSLAERVLCFPIHHHESVVEASKALVERFGALRVLIGDHLERSCKVAATGCRGYLRLNPLKEIERDRELVACYQSFSQAWKRFAFLLFKERAYQLVQVDEEEIESLMETTSRLTA